jgi:hypothetical protein
MSESLTEKFMNLSLASVVRKVTGRGNPAVSSGQLQLDQIPKVSVAQIAGKPIIRVEGSYSYRDGYLPWCDLIALLSVLVERSPRTILEIGTFNGFTTRMMALNLPNAEIHTIDLPVDFTDGNAGLQKDDFHLIASRRVGSEYLADPSIKTITQHFGDTAEYAFPPAEFFFIDGSHTYDYVRNDTKKALACGIAKTLVWHDCDHLHEDVTRWLIEMIQNGYPVCRFAGTNLAFLDLSAARSV